MLNAPVEQSAHIAAGHAATAPETGTRSENSNGHALSSKGYGTGKSKKVFRAHDTAAEMFAALLGGPKSIEDIKRKTGMCESSVRKYINAFRKSGVIYRQGLEPARREAGQATKRGGHLYALQPSLFAIADTEVK